MTARIRVIGTIILAREASSIPNAPSAITTLVVFFQLRITRERSHDREFLGSPIQVG
jgi:hypothetical protein